MGGESKRAQEGEGPLLRSSRVRSSRASRAFPAPPLRTPATQCGWKSTRKTRAEKTGCSQANEILMNLRPGCQSHNGYQLRSRPALLVLYLGYVWCRNMGKMQKKVLTKWFLTASDHSKDTTSDLITLCHLKIDYHGEPSIPLINHGEPTIPLTISWPRMTF